MFLYYFDNSSHICSLCRSGNEKNFTLVCMEIIIVSLNFSIFFNQTQCIHPLLKARDHTLHLTQQNKCYICLVNGQSGLIYKF